MTMTKDMAALNDWYVVGISADVRPAAPRCTRLLGQDILVTRKDDGTVAVTLEGGDEDGRAARAEEHYGFIWTTFGAPNRGIFPLAEAFEPDRRVVTCGTVDVGASGLRLVENFLDMAHFPFVHTDILGALDKPEVEQYQAEIRADVDEVWATNCRFWQPLAAAASKGGQMSHYVYRVVTPFNVLLYKTCPEAPDRFDVIALFSQPVEADRSIAYPLMVVVDSISTDEDIVMFQQKIFLQDRIILENQRPRTLPLDPRAEIPTRADLSSVAYRRWLKTKALRYGSYEYEEA
ncbi:aromatic ring-hydroxylating oxygenase subunit alpha [Allorhizobium borbori]|uniref:Phenylpropionate dioxygenase-like ring-hydroxylating dioxygenase large terminal subunit n=1 Tax=Allorhizobium borbori TaxID=485907 RepID=A0A7W6K5X6_9HYPH|nr:aromatic ring-hydroxylating dioxygenase subunit alpha [Allorhizobium borbori]MBB4105730.1 phenylpropionate dioxygenase-like ring-hydroxylating dioxygenase large terminal subunit [Allorhizobium borbori]